MKVSKLRTTALLLAAPATAAVGFAVAAPATAATLPAVCTTASPIHVNGAAFYPAQVAPGQSGTADLITTNCTNLSVATAEEWLGQWLPSTSAGCPVIDPFVRDVTYAPGQELAENTTYLVPVGCKATELKITVHISNSAGVNLVSASAILRILQPAK